MKTAKGLVAHAEYQFKRGSEYWYGTFGQVGTIGLLNWCAGHYPNQMYPSRVKEAKARDIGRRVTDCVGLIKWYLWTDTLNDVPDYGSHGFPDVNVSGIKLTCPRRGLINTLPEVPGTLVFIEGHHVGIYVGKGWVIEARGFNYDVVKTRLEDGAWTDWGQTSWLDYGTRVPTRPTEAVITPLEKKQLFKIKVISPKGVWLHTKPSDSKSTRKGVADCGTSWSITKKSGNWGYAEAVKLWITTSGKYVKKY